MPIITRPDVDRRLPRDFNPDGEVVVRSATVVSDYRAIFSSSWNWDNGVVVGQAVFLTFSFESQAANDVLTAFGQTFVDSFEPLTEAQKTAARAALQAWADASGITFFEVESGMGDIRFGNYDFSTGGSYGPNEAAAYAYYPGSGLGGDVFIGSTGFDYFQIFAHEIGHALGFKHTFQGENVLGPDEDDYAHSVMSYTAGGSAGDQLGTIDLQAVAYVYGDADRDGTQVASWSWDPATSTLTQTGFDTAEFIRAVSGYNVIHAAGGADVVNGADFDDQLYGEGGDDSLTGAGGDDDLRGAEGADSLYGGAGDDRLEGGADADYLSGEGGDDVLDGGAGDDRLADFYAATLSIDGGAGTDALYLQAQDFTAPVVFSLTASGVNVTGVETVVLQGGEANDSLTGASGGEILHGFGGDDVLNGMAGRDYLGGDAGDDRLSGGDDGDSLYGGAGADRLEGGAGDDYLSSGGTAGPGVDVLLGGSGSDTLQIDAGSLFDADGGEGEDSLTINASSGSPFVFSLTAALAAGSSMIGIERFSASGGSMADTITGAGLTDNIWGAAGNDVLTGGLGADYLDGGDGDDVLRGGAGGDNMWGGAGVDLVSFFDDAAGVTATVNLTRQLGDGSWEYMSQVEGLIGSAFADVLTGDGGANILDGGGGVDRLTGGLGDDVYYVDSNSDLLVEAKDQGKDTVYASVSYTLQSGVYVEALTLTGSANINGTGNGIANTLRGNAGNNSLNGAAGADKLYGGKGNDTYYVDNSGDKAYESNGDGTDTVIASVSYSLAGQYIEALTLTGSANLNAIGNTLNNTLTGNAGINVLTGGKGNDAYYVQNTTDSIVELKDEGTDTVFSSVNFVLRSGVYVEALTLTGTADLSATGNGIANLLTGNSGKNVLDGGKGADRMVGGLGDDSYYVDNKGDVVVEAKGQGTDHVFSSVDFSLKGQYIEYLTLTGSANIYAKGNTLDNRLVGNAGNNKLNGMEGQDRLTGGAGADTFIWDATSHSKVSNSDRITDLSNSDFIDLSRIDANVNASGTQHFTLVDAFTNTAGQVMLKYDAATKVTSLTADTNGDGVADMLIRIDGNHEDFDNFIFGG